MSTAQMREVIKQPYGKTWKDKVNKMPDYQVRAIYTRFLAAKLI